MKYPRGILVSGVQFCAVSPYKSTSQWTQRTNTDDNENFYIYGFMYIVCRYIFLNCKYLLPKQLLHYSLLYIYLLNVVFSPNLSVVVNINLENEILIFVQWFPPGNCVCSEDGDSLQRLIDQLKKLDGVNKRQMTDSTGSVPSLDTSDLQSQEASKRQQENADIRPQKR